jgi:hypothetical protein
MVRKERSSFPGRPDERPLWTLVRGGKMPMGDAPAYR